jgi:hypothetical protein
METKTIEADWIDPYLRELVGETPPLSLEMELLRLGASQRRKRFQYTNLRVASKKKFQG